MPRLRRPLRAQPSVLPAALLDGDDAAWASRASAREWRRAVGLPLAYRDDDTLSSLMRRCRAAEDWARREGLLLQPWGFVDRTRVADLGVDLAALAPEALTEHVRLSGGPGVLLTGRGLKVSARAAYA